MTEPKVIKFDWRELGESLKVRFSLTMTYAGHTFICSENRELSESAWQSIDSVVRTMECRLKGFIMARINRMIEHDQI